jgi:hypothetical protein
MKAISHNGTEQQSAGMNSSRNMSIWDEEGVGGREGHQSSLRALHFLSKNKTK